MCCPHKPRVLDPPELLSEELQTSKYSKSEREFDLVVVGATGFTGKLALEYLCKNYPQNERKQIRILTSAHQNHEVLFTVAGPLKSSRVVHFFDFLTKRNVLVNAKKFVYDSKLLR